MILIQQVVYFPLNQIVFLALKTIIFSLLHILKEANSLVVFSMLWLGILFFCTYHNTYMDVQGYFIILISNSEPTVVTYTINSSTQKAEGGKSLSCGPA